MTYASSGAPSAADFYRAGLLASALAYLGIMLLIVASLLVDGGGAQAALSWFFIGGLYGAIPAVGIAFLITAPLGCLVGIALREWFEPSQWHGAINGGITAVALLFLAFVLIGGEFREAPDPGTILFVTGIILVGAGSGWIAQRKVLDWPSEHSEDHAAVFE